MIQALSTFCSVRRVMLILGIDVLVSGSEVGYRIGNPTNIDFKSEAESPSTSTAVTAHYQSEYIGALCQLYLK